MLIIEDNSTKSIQNFLTVHLKFKNISIVVENSCLFWVFFIWTLKSQTLFWYQEHKDNMMIFVYSHELSELFWLG